MYKSILTMKKKTLQFVMALGLLFLSGSTIAQDIKELGFSYQAVARDNSGLALANKNIVVEISIRQGSTTGITLWQETHQVATNKFGLFNVVVGKGVATGVGTLSSFDQIDWSSADYFTNVRADFGNGLLPMGVVQLQATPYAFVADTALAAPRFPLSELLDVDVTTLTTNDVLKWNGSAWIPGGFSNDFDAVYAKINADSTAIATDLAAEVAARIAGDAANASAIANNTADISTIETDLAAEITRATNAETAIAADLVAEETARIAGDAANATAIANNTADISTIETDLAAEITRATNAETAIAADLVAEETARIAGDAANATAIATETTNRTNADALKADIASPTLTGVPAAPTATAGTNTTQIATTAFVTDAVTTATPDATTLVKGKVQLAGDLTGTAELPTIANDAVTTAKILDANVTTAKIADNAVRTAKILDANVTDAKIATGVDAAKLADGSVSNTEFQYIDGATSNIQTQLDAKAPIASPTFTGTVTAPTLVSGDVTYPNTDGTAGQVLTTDGSGELSWTDTYDGLTHFTESTYTNSGKTGVKLLATNAEADVDVVIGSKGTGALLAQEPDGTEAGGNNRGNNAVDLQMVRDDANQVASGNFSTISGGDKNRASGGRSTVSGGRSNTATGTYSTISGGENNTATTFHSTVSGGRSNTASSNYTTVSGGENNTASTSYSTVSGGRSNTASGSYSTILGGRSNTASGQYSVALGQNNNATSLGEVVLGRNALEQAGDPFDFVGSDRLFAIGNGTTSNARSSALTVLKNGNTTIAGTLTLGDITIPNTDGTAGQVLVTDGSGELSWAAASLTHFTESTYLYDTKNGVKLVPNHAEADVDVVIGRKGTGALLAQEPDGTEAGGNNRGNNAVDLQMDRDDANQVASGNFSTISGGDFNTASGDLSTVSGGRQNVASGSRSTISGGDFNTASGNRSTVSGGQDNTASGNRSTISGGRSNTATSLFSTVSGGENNTASGEYSFVVGRNNNATSLSEIVLGQFALEQAGDPFVFVGSDRLFAIGNGIGVDARSSALTVLKNGNTTIAGTLTLGDITIPNTDGTAGQVLVTDGSGELSWAAASLTHFTESTYLYDTKNGVKLVPNHAEANVDVVIGSKGTGALLANQPDGLASGGNNRGSGAIDLQTSRGVNTQVASGDDSNILGGINNTASGFRSSVVGGFNNTSSGQYSLSSGRQTNASGDYSVALGHTNTSSGDFSIALGFENTSSSFGETTIGLYATNAVGNAFLHVPSDRLFAIGNGTAWDARSNALTVLKNGNTTIAGTLTLGDITIPNTDGTAGQVLVTDGSGELSWASVGASTLAIGDSYQGGIIFWLDDTGKHGLIAATADQSTGIQWYNGSAFVSDAVRDGVYAGIYNTERNIIGSGAGSYAAQLCANYQGGGYGDWYLPSKYELNLLYLQKDFVGGFSSADYWSSTENNEASAWFQDFNLGVQDPWGKGTGNRVRAIRSF
jgi:hypothetical protein